jgi:hypothetical protein
VVKGATSDADQEHQEANYGRDDPQAASQSQYLCLELDLSHLEYVKCHHVLGGSVEPAGRGGSWHSEIRRDAQVARLANELAESVVVGLSVSVVWHPDSIMNRLQWECYR